MPSGKRMLWVYLAGGMAWVVALMGVGAAVALARRGPESLLAVLAFVIMTAVFTILRITTGNISISVGALVSYLSIPVLGVWPAVGAKVIGYALATATGRRKLTRKALTQALANGAILGLSVFVAGAVYRAAGGPVARVFSLSLIAPYLAMSLTYTVVNFVLVGLATAVIESQVVWGSVVDTLRRLWVNGALFVVVGLLGQGVYSQMGLYGLLLVFALLIAVRFTFRLYAETQRFRSEMADVLARVLQFKDPYTGEHSARVAELAVAIGRQLGLTEMQRERLHDSALLHDIGKVAVPDAVLVKPGPLDVGEKATMERHVGAGGELLEKSPHLRELAGYVRAHHTTFSAQTQPQGSPLEARIIAVADAFDAMTSDRPYRKALPQAEALQRLLAGAGSQFDPGVVEALLRTLPGAPRAELRPPGGPGAAPGAAGNSKEEAADAPQGASGQGGPLRAQVQFL